MFQTLKTTYKDKSLTVDPWLEGSVFNKSWNLLIETPAKSLQTVKKSDYFEDFSYFTSVYY